MHTVESVRRAAVERLQQLGIDNAPLDVRVLLAKALEVTPDWILLHPEKEVEEGPYLQFQHYVEQRLARKPVSHIIGSREFWGLHFKVTDATLAPRPDSETVIESVLRYYKDTKQPLRLLDIGTGTGCLLLTLLHLYPNAHGVGVDISQDALAVAKENSAVLGLANRSSFLLECWTNGLEGWFDVIVSNPPYIKTDDIAQLEPEVSRYEPHLALDGGVDGLACYRALVPQFVPLMRPGSLLVFECGEGQAEEIAQLTETYGLNKLPFGYDLAGIARCVCASKPG